MPDEYHIRPEGYWIYGRVDRFVMACPECGGLFRGDNRPGLSAALQAPPGRGTKIGREQIYRWRAARALCPFCRTTFAIGLAIWRTGKPFYERDRPPADQDDPLWIGAELRADQPALGLRAAEAGEAEDKPRPWEDPPAAPGAPPDDDRPEAEGGGRPAPAPASAPPEAPGEPEDKAEPEPEAEETEADREAASRPPGELGGWFARKERVWAGDTVNLDLGDCSCGAHPWSDPRCPIHGYE